MINQEGLPPVGRPLVVAVSGGCDSMALWALLAELDQWPLTIWHLNHGLRPDAGADGDLIRDCALPGVRRIEFADIATLARSWKCGLEEAGRRQRYARLVAVAREVVASVVVTAHHQNDQAETILFNLLRGSHGLVGMPRMRSLAPGVNLLRPLLATTRAELRAWAITHEVPWREDVTNRDLRFSRNYIRHRVLPTLLTGVPDLIPALTAAVRTELEPLPALLRQLEVSPSRALIRRLTALPIGGRLAVGGWLLTRTVHGWAHEVEHPPAPAAALTVGLGTWHRGGRRLKVRTATAAEIVQPQCPPGQGLLARAAVNGAIEWRAPVAGESWQPLGCSGTQTLFETAARRRIPARQRPDLTVIADALGPLWLEPGVVAERARVTSGSEAWHLTLDARGDA